MAKKIFITGTGTDVGKTYISALIVKKMREAGFNCGYFKPVISGVTEMCGHLMDSGANYVIQTANIPAEPENCVSYYWQEAVSPHLAAKRKNQEIDIDKIKYDFAQINKKYDYLLIEGAGGITCPLKINSEEKYLLKDLIWELGLSVIIIADAGLGTINSTLLTVDYARANGIEIEGIILNNYESDNFMHWDNLEQIETLTGINVVATVGHNASDIMLLEGLFKE
jgi:dethiobiotin synthetase